MTFGEAVPIIKLGPNLLVSLHGDLDDATALRIEKEITDMVACTRSTGVLLDVGGLAVVDTFIARVIARIAGMTRFLGAQSVVVGIQPAVAITLVELGVRMQHLNTALNAAEGMALLGRIRS